MSGEASYSYAPECQVDERTIHNPHPSQPKKVSFSLRNIEERIAQMTTDNAPKGV